MRHMVKSIETDRLLLVPISRKYADVIFKEFTPEITTYMAPKPPEKIEDTYEFIDSALDKMAKGNNIQLVILSKTNKEFLGCVGLHHIDTKTPELGIWTKKSAHGHKYGREAITGLVDWARKNLDFDYLLYPVDKRNIPSRRIPESLGGIPIRELKKPVESGKILDEIEFKINK